MVCKLMENPMWASSSLALMSRKRCNIVPSFSEKAPYGFRIHLILLEVSTHVVDPMFKLMATPILAFLTYASILSECFDSKEFGWLGGSTRYTIFELLKNVCLYHISALKLNNFNSLCLPLMPSTCMIPLFLPYKLQSLLANTMLPSGYLIKVPSILFYSERPLTLTPYLRRRTQ